MQLKDVRIGTQLYVGLGAVLLLVVLLSAMSFVPGGQALAGDPGHV